MYLEIILVQYFLMLTSNNRSAARSARVSEKMEACDTILTVSPVIYSRDLLRVYLSFQLIFEIKQS